MLFFSELMFGCTWGLEVNRFRNLSTSKEIKRTNGHQSDEVLGYFTNLQRPSKLSRKFPNLYCLGAPKSHLCHSFLDEWKLFHIKHPATGGSGCKIHSSTPTCCHASIVPPWSSVSGHVSPQRWLWLVICYVLHRSNWFLFGHFGINQWINIVVV